MVGVDETSKPSDEGFKYLFKVVVIGPESVGKTAIVSRFVEDSFTSTYNATIGVDFRAKNIPSNNNEVVKLQIWDTAGQERFRVISRSYYRGAHGILLVFDITKQLSFKSMLNFYKEIKETTFADCPILLVGTNSDLKEKREVTQEQAEDFVQEIGISYIEVSSKTGDNVTDAFQVLIEQIMKNQNIQGTLTSMSTMPQALGNKAKAKTSPSKDDDSLHELENKSTMLEAVKFKRSAKKSKLCIIL